MGSRRRGSSGCRGDTFGDGLLGEPVALSRVHRRVGPIDRELVEVWATEADQLGVEVGEVPGLKKRIVGEIDPRGTCAVRMPPVRFRRSSSSGFGSTSSGR